LRPSRTYDVTSGGNRCRPTIAEENLMKKLQISLAVVALSAAAPALAHHVEYLDVPFDSRGACEAQMASLSNEDDFLIDQFPDLFSSEGEVRSFLNMAFKCEQNRGDGAWYITDYRSEVLASDWFTRRL
jgi:hypothetical protein